MSRELEVLALAFAWWRGRDAAEGGLTWVKAAIARDWKWMVILYEAKA